MNSNKWHSVCLCAIILFLISTLRLFFCKGTAQQGLLYTLSFLCKKESNSGLLLDLFTYSGLSSLSKDRNISQAKNSEVVQHSLQKPQELRLRSRKVAGQTHLHLYSFATTSAAVFCYTESGISDMFLWYLWKPKEQPVTIYTTKEHCIKWQLHQETRLLMQMPQRGCRFHFFTTEVKWWSKNF